MLEQNEFASHSMKITDLKLHTSTAYINSFFLNVHSSVGGVTVKSNVIHLLFTLCLLVQRSKLCTV